MQPVGMPSAELGALVGGKYRVMGELGSGAMGMVLLGRDEQLERDVALKLIRPEAARRRSFQRDFVAEARAMAKINHGNVVRVYDFGWDDATPYFVMELVDGVDLESHHAARKYRLPLSEAIDVTLQICRGVEAIHEAGVVHRDLKPSNILVARDGRVLVSDLGLTATVDDDPGAVIGTPGFVAPEVVMNGAAGGTAAERADVYALGALAYELISGQPAFVGDDPTAVLQAQLEGGCRTLSSVTPSRGPTFGPAVHQALARDPLDRLPSAAEFIRALELAYAQHRDPSFGQRIVVVDDDPVVRRWLQRILTHHLPGVDVESVANGRDALHGLSTANAAVVVVDYEMPGLGGAELVEMLRGLPRFDETAIVVISSRAGPTEWTVLRKAGADGFLMKPLDPVPLVALVQSLMKDPKRNRGEMRRPRR